MFSITVRNTDLHCKNSESLQNFWPNFSSTHLINQAISRYINLTKPRPSSSEKLPHRSADCESSLSRPVFPCYVRRRPLLAVVCSYYYSSKGGSQVTLSGGSTLCKEVRVDRQAKQAMQSYFNLLRFCHIHPVIGVTYVTKLFLT